MVVPVQFAQGFPKIENRRLGVDLTANVFESSAMMMPRDNDLRTLLEIDKALQVVHLNLIQGIQHVSQSRVAKDLASSVLFDLVRALKTSNNQGSFFTNDWF
jgi:uncharacterized protein (UPF0254 family)